VVALYVKKACLLAVRAWYMPMRATYVVACVVFIYMKIFVHFIKQACLQLFPNLGGGVDNSIQWLRFAQQK
jgi:hypothetical protein